DDTLLPDHEVRPLWNTAGTHLARKSSQVVHTLSSVNHRALARLFDCPRDRRRYRPIELERAPTHGVAAHPLQNTAGDAGVIEQLEEERGGRGVGDDR